LALVPKRKRRGRLGGGVPAQAGLKWRRISPIFSDFPCQRLGLTLSRASLLRRKATKEDQRDHPMRRVFENRPT
jgi:hypothetical protein